MLLNTVSSIQVLYCRYLYCILQYIAVLLYSIRIQGTTDIQYKLFRQKSKYPMLEYSTVLNTCGNYTLYRYCTAPVHLINTGACRLISISVGATVVYCMNTVIIFVIEQTKFRTFVLHEYPLYIVMYCICIFNTLYRCSCIIHTASVQLHSCIVL